MGKNPPTRTNHLPTPGISPKCVSRLFFVILFQNAIKLAGSNVELQKNFPGVAPSDLRFKGRGRGLERRGREGREKRRGRKGYGEGEVG